MSDPERVRVGAQRPGHAGAGPGGAAAWLGGEAVHGGGAPAGGPGGAPPARQPTIQGRASHATRPRIVPQGVV